MNELSNQILNEYFDASKTGFWKRELENGVTVRLFADKNMIELLGAPEGLTPEQYCVFFGEHIYPEDSSLMAEFDKELIKGNAEVVYRYNHPVDGLIYVRCGGRMTRSVGNQMTFVGYHKELSDTVHVEDGKEIAKVMIQRNRDMQLQKSQTYYRALMNQVACGIVEYTVTDNHVQYANEELLRILGAKDIEDIQKNLNQLWNCTTCADSALVSNINKLNAEDGILNFEGSVTGLDGQTRNIMARVESVTTPQGERSIFATFLDTTENRILKSDRHIFDALCKDYETFFFIDFRKRKIYALKTHQDMTDFNKRAIRETDFDKYEVNFKKFYEESVDKETSPDYEQKLSMSFLEKELEVTPTYTYRFNTRDTYEKHYFEVFVSKVAGIEEAAIMGYRLIDDIIAEEEKKKAELEKNHKLLQEQMHVASGLANAYFAVFRVDVGANQCWPVKNIPFFEEAIQGSMRTDEVTNAFITLCVEEEDRRKMYDFTNPHFLEKQLITNEVIVEEFHGKVAPWEWCRASWIVASRDEAGMPETILFTVEDITALAKERKKHEQNEELNKVELQQAKEKAETADKAKTAFLFNMSHDIRTPMNALLGYNKLIQDELQDPKLRGYLEKSEQAGKLLLSIINNVLDMARIESGRMELDENYLKASSIIEEIQSVFESEAERKNLKLICDIQVEHEHMIGDDTKLKEIFLNLVSNAVKYTPSGGEVKFLVKEIPCNRDGYMTIKTEVIDNGIGMSKDYLPVLFDSFTRERSTTSSNTPGTGLGMAIVKKLVELMGGRIEVESELGKGTRFTVTISHKIADKAYYEKKKKELSGNSMKDQMVGKHVLLAEDNELNAEIAIAILDGMGLVVDRVADGIQCISQLEKKPADTYDLILMDIQMPNMDGYKATELIRRLKDEKKSHIPIVAMTANAFEEDRKDAFAAGMNGHIAKPIDEKKVEEILSSLL